MRAIRLLLGGAVWAVTLATGVMLIVAAWSGSDPWGVAAWVMDRRELAMPVGILTVGLAALWPMSLIARATSERHLSFRNPDGEVRIRLDAIRDFLARLASEFPGVESLRSVVRLKSGGLAIDLQCRVQAGRAVADLSRSLQERARICIQSDLGIAEIRSIDVTIREFVGFPTLREPVVRAPRPGEGSSMEDGLPPT